MMQDLQKLNWITQYTLQESAVSTAMRAWLLHSGSFMERLREQGVLHPRIEVLLQEWQSPESWECDVLHLDLQAQVLVREVLILSDGKYWMFARTVFPEDTLTGEEAELAHLKNRPLGDYLFNHSDMRRSEFAFTTLSTGMEWYQKIENTVPALNDKELWSRYSIFHLQKKSLLLTEVFLPDITNL